MLRRGAPDAAAELLQWKPADEDRLAEMQAHAAVGAAAEWQVPRPDGAPEPDGAPPAVESGPRGA